MNHNELPHFPAPHWRFLLEHRLTWSLELVPAMKVSEGSFGVSRREASWKATAHMSYSLNSLKRVIYGSI